METAPIIGLGCQRSGTSVTGHILAAPPASGFQMENGIMRMSAIWFRNTFNDGAALAASRFNEFLRALSCRNEDHGARIQKHATQAIVDYQNDGRLEQWIANDDGAGFVRSLCFDVLSGGEQVGYWGDKYPEHLFLIDDLHAVFPDARWLFIWREPAAVIEALSRKIFNSRRRPVSNWRFSVEDCATQWVTWNRKWIEARDRLPQGAWAELSFDELVQDPSSKLSVLSEFIGFDLLEDRASKRRASSLRPGDLEKWRKSKHAAEIEAQLEREDLQSVHSALRGSDDGSS